METPILNRDQKVILLNDFIHRTAFHHVMWFNQVAKFLGKEKAYSILEKVYKQSSEIQIKRISKIFSDDGNIINISDKKVDQLLESVAINWLANDGVWFQAVEFSSGMSVAKRCNDTCWAEFSPFEAWSIKQLANISENSGLEGLKKAFNFRLYTYINKQSIVEETSKSFVFKMNDCRVQSARKRKGLDDYPCKSGGLVEYTEFALAIDPRISTECISCPPDTHPEEFFCSWKFSIS